MPTIASLNTVLTASDGQFTGAMMAAQKALGGLTGAVESSHAKIVGVVGAITGLAGAAGIGALVKAQMGAIDSTAKVADQLGISTEALVGLRHAADLAGVGNEEFDASLRKMQKSIGDASVSGGSAAEKFEALGLSVNDLANSSPDQQFIKISEAITSIENPAQRAAAVTDIFGKQGQKLLNTMLGGAGAIKDATAETELFGTSLSRVEAAKVEAANDSLTRVGRVVEGIGTQLAVAVAPYIDAAAKKFIEFATAGGGIRSTVGVGLEFVAGAVATTADMVEALKLGFQFLQVKATQGLAYIVGGLSTLTAGAESALKYLGVDVGAGVSDSLKTASEEMLSTAANLDAQLAEAFTGKSWGDKVRDTMAGIEQAADQAGKAAAAAIPKPAQVSESTRATAQLADGVGKLEEKLREQVATVGMSGEEIELWKLQQAGATDEALAGARGLLAQKQAADKQAKSIDEGKKLTEELQSPLEKYRAELAKIDDLQRRGAIDAQTAMRAQNRAAEELDKATSGAGKTAQPQLADALQAGSQEALNAVARFEQTGRAGSEDKQAELVDENKKHTELLRRLEAKFPTLALGAI